MYRYNATDRPPPHSIEACIVVGKLQMEKEEPQTWVRAGVGLELGDAFSASQARAERARRVMTSLCERRLAGYPSASALAAMAGERERDSVSESGSESGSGSNSGSGSGSESGSESGRGSVEESAAAATASAAADDADDESTPAFGAAGAARLLRSETRALRGSLALMEEESSDWVTPSLSCDLP